MTCFTFFIVQFYFYNNSSHVLWQLQKCTFSFPLFLVFVLWLMIWLCLWQEFHRYKCLPACIQLFGEQEIRGENRIYRERMENFVENCEMVKIFWNSEWEVEGMAREWWSWFGIWNTNLIVLHKGTEICRIP